MRSNELSSPGEVTNELGRARQTVMNASHYLDADGRIFQPFLDHLISDTRSVARFHYRIGKKELIATAITVGAGLVVADQSKSRAAVFGLGIVIFINALKDFWDGIGHDADAQIYSNRSSYARADSIPRTLRFLPEQA